MRTLIFITSRFPYDPGEAFIESEFPYLYSAFSRTIIITLNKSGKIIKPIPDDVKVYRYNLSMPVNDYLLIPLMILRNFTQVRNLISEELHFRKDSGRKTTRKQKLFLLKSIIKSLRLRDFIDNIVGIEKPEGELVFYSYWMNFAAHAICMLQNSKGLKISRAHGGDLYEEAAPLKYQPLEKFSFRNLDAIFFISEFGKEYFERRYSLVNEKNIVSRLGITNNYPFNPEVPEKDYFRIITCANLNENKRIHLAISALAKVKSPGKIIWEHFGEGVLEQTVKDLAENTFRNNEKIEYKFHGRVLNALIMKFYSENPVDMLLNLSISEGIPVNIMEAQSFGIPVIATDAGGTKEIVNNETGILLPVTFDPDELAGKIEYLLNLDRNQKIGMKNAVYNNWKTNFNAAYNYGKFIGQLNEILMSTKK